MKNCHHHCLHRQSVSDYRDAVFARDEARENGEYMRMEDDEFDEVWPVLTFKQWLEGRKR